MENPAETAITTDKKWMKFFGEGMTVPACPYGRKSSKKYHLWMSPATEKEFRKVMIMPTDAKSLCKECKEGKQHLQAQCKKKGDPRPGVSEEGFGKELTRIYRGLKVGLSDEGCDNTIASKEEVYIPVGIQHRYSNTRITKKKSRSLYRTKTQGPPHIDNIEAWQKNCEVQFFFYPMLFKRQ